MRVFVAGATGVLGRRAVAELAAAGFEVTGIARSPEKGRELREAGATPITVSLFDPAGLRAAISGHDAVLNLATAIPTGAAMASAEAWQTNDRIRRDGSRNLVDAALAAGASHYVQESITFVYADGGDRLLDESAPVAPTRVTASALDAESQAARFADAGGHAVALRFAGFYAPDAAHTVDTIAAARAGQPPEPGRPDAYRSSIHVDDAAAAVVAALDAPSGTYNVADDRPLRRDEFVAALEVALGAGPLVRPSDVDLAADVPATLRSHRISNARFKQVTAWQPRYPSAWEGWPAVLGALDEARSS